jgi:hypothetical protein
MRMRNIIVTLALLWTSGIIVGCIVTGNVYTCENPDPKHLAPDGLPDPCHYSDDGGTDGHVAADVGYSGEDAADDAGDGG